MYNIEPKNVQYVAIKTTPQKSADQKLEVSKVPYVI